MRSWARRLALAVGVPAAAAALVVAPGVGLAAQAPDDRPREVATTPGGPTSPASPDATDGGSPAHPTAVPAGPASEPGPSWIAVPPKTDVTAVARARGGMWSTEIPFEATGSVRTVPGSDPAPRDAERVVTVRIAVEDGLPVDGPAFADVVLATLNDPRGWGHDGSVVFARTDSGGDVDVTLASPATTDRLCYPVDTQGRVSCGRVGYAVLNAANWAQGAEPFLAGGGTVEEYRQYLVNHEVGHVLGNPHVGCPAPGELAPVMLQQTLRLEGCLPNPWPAP